MFKGIIDAHQKEVERWLIFANNLEVLLDEIGDVESWAHTARADIETTFGELREKKDSTSLPDQIDGCELS
jgi:hypothetical protein